MTNPSDSSNQGSNTPGNTREAPRPRRAQSVTPPVHGQESETSEPRVAGVSVSPSRQPVSRGFRPRTAADSPATRVTPTAFFPGHHGGGAIVGESSGGGGGGGGGLGLGLGGVSAGMAVLQIEASTVGGSGGNVQRKRTREGGAGAGGSSVGDGAPPPEGHRFSCCVCGRDDFRSLQSLGGHMKIHPERTWRGAFPPPVFSRDEFGDVLGLVVGGADGQEAAADDQGTATAAVTVTVGAPPPDQTEGGGGLDLNAVPQEHAEDEPDPEPSSSTIKLEQDLNKSPPPED